MTYLLMSPERSFVNSMDGLTLSQKFNAYKGMTFRNIKVFFKDKMTVFFSILAPLIVFLLYILFLKEAYMSSIKGDLASVSHLIDMNDVENIANGWLLSGILASSCITVSLNSLSVMVDDKDRKVDYDYNSSPSNGHIVVLSYFTGALVNTLLITCGVLTIGLISLSVIGSLYLTVTKVILLYLVTILGCASATLLMMVIASFFKKAGALGAFGGIVSAAIGFIIGAYVPLGSFSTGVQTTLAFIPGSQVASIYRELLMGGVTEHVANAMGSNGGPEFLESIRNEFSLSLTMFSYKTTEFFSFMYTIGSIVVGLILNIVLYKKSSKRK